MRSDNVNKIIHLVSAIKDKRALTLEMRNDLLMVIGTEFRVNTINNAAVVSSVSDVDGIQPVYVVPKSNNNFVIVFNLTKMDDYSPEELTALLINSLVQNALSTITKTRIRGLLLYTSNRFKNSARNVELASYNYDNRIMGIISISCAMNPYLTYIIPESENTLTGGDILIDCGLHEFYNSAITKVFGTSDELLKILKDGNKMGSRNLEIIDEVDSDDIKMCNLIASKFTNAVDDIYNLPKASVKNLSDHEIATMLVDEFMDQLTNIYGMNFKTVNLYNYPLFSSEFSDFKSQDFTKRESSNNANCQNGCNPVSESILIPINEGSVKIDTRDVRYNLDRLIVKANYLDTESERIALLMSVRAIGDGIDKLSKDLEKKGTRDNDYESKRKYLDAANSELDVIRQDIVSKKIAPASYGIYTADYPSSYTSY